MTAPRSAEVIKFLHDSSWHLGSRRRFWTRVSFSLILGAKYQGCDPGHMLFGPTGTLNHSKARRHHCHVPRPISAYDGLSYLIPYLFLSYSLALIRFILCTFTFRTCLTSFHINKMPRWVFGKLVGVYTIDVSEKDSKKQIPQYTVNCGAYVLLIPQIPENKEVWINSKTKCEGEICVERQNPWQVGQQKEKQKKGEKTGV